MLFDFMFKPVTQLSPIREMLALRFFKTVLALSFLGWLVTVILPTVRVLPVIYGKTAVPLHYNVHIGVDTVGPWWRIYLVPAVGLLIILCNVWLARYMWSRDQVLAYVAGFATLVLQGILVTAMIFIVYLSLQYA